MRCFEATSTGSLLITEEVYGLDELFEYGKEIVTYKTTEEAMEKIQYYLDHEKEREEIAARGRARTDRDHSYKQRLDEMLKINKII